MTCTEHRYRSRSPFAARLHIYAFLALRDFVFQPMRRGCRSRESTSLPSFPDHLYDARAMATALDNRRRHEGKTAMARHGGKTANNRSMWGRIGYHVALRCSSLVLDHLLEAHLIISRVPDPLTFRTASFIATTAAGCSGTCLTVRPRRR